MDFSSRRLADVVVAAPAGQLDHVNALPFEEALKPLVEAASAGRTPLLLDFSNVEYISSMGLRVLMVAARQMRASQAAFAVAALRPEVEEIFEIARFRFVVDVHPSVRAALVALSAPGAAAYDAAAT